MTYRILGALAALSIALVASAAEAAPVTPSALGASVDCSEVYGKAATCQIAVCGALYSSFLGDWTGPFEEYLQKESTPDKPVFRPYQDRVSYVARDCLKNPANGENFIIGRRTDTFPAFGAHAAQTKQGLIITGRRADGTAFLRTFDSDGANEYTMVSKDAETESAVWRLDVPASQNPCPTGADPKKICATPQLSFLLTDSRDQTLKPANVRQVTIEMTVGPTSQPYWHGVVARGHHERQTGGAT